MGKLSEERGVSDRLRAIAWKVVLFPGDRVMTEVRASFLVE
ncbi:hypothetical protein GCM10007216_05150 [Thalassobacillus devorans]|uniref:Uncharacterized protein n=1 Tax=Thalassobacillus devorans TaxID=279813 RepID=A0ABQ1NQJ7_9BACI|nr:hypothetical protein [Thalassobacillus devorans]NIK27422.1 hypothetical protein [Thalassobacillus devorans]GGC77583.1 hypothetical protein GCM10007216_05150 [Thalassobacillus devorans]